MHNAYQEENSLADEDPIYQESCDIELHVSHNIISHTGGRQPDSCGLDRTKCKRAAIATNNDGLR